MFDIPCSLCKEIITQEKQIDEAEWFISTAKMHDNKIFSYGNNGDYTFLEDLGLKKDDYVCLDCMNKNKYEPYCRLECSICHKKYQAMINNQGWGICADVFKDKDSNTLKIDCGYGSCYDMSIFEPINGFELKLNDLWCDECLKSNVEKCNLKRIPFDWDNGFKDLDIIEIKDLKGIINL